MKGDIHDPDNELAKALVLQMAERKRNSNPELQEAVDRQAKKIFAEAQRQKEAMEEQVHKELWEQARREGKV